MYSPEILHDSHGINTVENAEPDDEVTSQEARRVERDSSRLVIEQGNIKLQRNIAVYMIQAYSGKMLCDSDGEVHSYHNGRTKRNEQSHKSYDGNVSSVVLWDGV